MPAIAREVMAADSTIALVPSVPTLPAPRLGGYIQARELAQERAGVIADHALGASTTLAPGVFDAEGANAGARVQAQS